MSKIFFPLPPFLQAFRAGIVWINCSQPCFCQAPWGGIKRSGFGRELGEWYEPNFLERYARDYFLSAKSKRLEFYEYITNIFPLFLHNGEFFGYDVNCLQPFFTPR